MLKRLVLAVLLLLGAAMLVTGLLMKFAGLKFEADGTGIPKIAKFDDPEQRYRELEERSKAERPAQAAEPAAPAGSAASIAPSAPEASVAGPVVEPAKAVAAPWPSFYGANRDGRYVEGPILTAWPESGLKRIWKRPVGGGYASMIVAEDRIFTIEQRRDHEFAVAYDLATGKEAWTSSWKEFFQESMGGDGPRATPAYDAGRVYFLGAAGEFRCLNAKTGALIWRKNILEDNGAANIQWGMAASPLVVDEMVIVLPGGGGGKSVVAYNKKTGARMWSALDDKAAYTAPMVASLNGVRQLVVVSGQRAMGLTLDGGRLLWEFPWVTDYEINGTLPIIVGENRVILSAGYGHGAAMIELQRAGETWPAREVWKSQAMKCKFNNAVLHKGVVYGLDEGILAAMDAQTGKRLWKGGRYGYGQVLLAGDHLVITTESGEVALVRASPESHQELAKFEAVDGKTWNVPAIAGGRLLVRNTTEMAAFEIGGAGPK